MLWSNVDANTGAPKFQVGASRASGVKVTGDGAYQNVATGVFVSGQQVGVFGVDAAESANTGSEGHKVTHAGWVKRIVGTGPVGSITIVSGGAGYASNGFLVFTGGGGQNANASFISNGSNITSIIINDGGFNFNTAPTVRANLANTVIATFTVTMGGRANRVGYETLVAMGSMTPGANTDNSYFLP